MLAVQIPKRFFSSYCAVTDMTGTEWQQAWGDVYQARGAVAAQA